VARFYVTVTMHYTVERPDAWTAEDEAGLVRTETVIGQYRPAWLALRNVAGGGDVPPLPGPFVRHRDGVA
jgi:hypothetical protein